MLRKECTGEEGKAEFVTRFGCNWPVYCDGGVVLFPGKIRNEAIGSFLSSAASNRSYS
jgi:hypothetical protein